MNARLASTPESREIVKSGIHILFFWHATHKHRTHT
jgi:hypothetical protein